MRANGSTQGGFKRYGGSVDWLLDWPHSNDALNVAGYALWHDNTSGFSKAHAFSVCYAFIYRSFIVKTVMYCMLWVLSILIQCVIPASTVPICLGMDSYTPTVIRVLVRHSLANRMVSEFLDYVWQTVSRYRGAREKKWPVIWDWCVTVTANRMVSEFLDYVWQTFSRYSVGEKEKRLEEVSSLLWVVPDGLDFLLKTLLFLNNDFVPLSQADWSIQFPPYSLSSLW